MISRDPKFNAPSFGHFDLSGFDKVFGDLLNTFAAPMQSGASALAGRSAAPAVDVYEEETRYVVEAAVPGLNGEQLTLEFEDGVLTLAGEWSTESEERRERAVRRERARGSFRRELRFADRVDAEGLTASLEGGILTITLPKSATAQKRRIDIDADAGGDADTE